MQPTETPMQKDVQEMAQLSRQLQELTNHPEFGLMSWYMMLGEKAKALNAIFKRSGLVD